MLKMSYLLAYFNSCGICWMQKEMPASHLKTVHKSGFQVNVFPFSQPEMPILLQKTLEKIIWLSYWRQKNDQRQPESWGIPLLLVTDGLVSSANAQMSRNTYCKSLWNSAQVKEIKDYKESSLRDKWNFKVKYTELLSLPTSERY